MNFKEISLKIALAATIVAGSFVATAPAEALNLSFSGSAKFDAGDDPTATNGLFDFGLADFNDQQAFVQQTTSSSLADIATFINLKDLTLNRVGNTNEWKLAAPVDSFITGFKDSTQVFNLTKFDFNADTKIAQILGTFVPPGILGDGSLTAQSSLVFSSGTSYSVQIIPTPALLPAAIGMGVAALRKKRKQEADADPASEPVEA